MDEVALTHPGEGEDETPAVEMADIEEAELDLLNKPISGLLRLNLEQGAYLVLLLIAFATRFWDLGARVMSHDESLHALFSWKLYTGIGYVHDPMMHGPFLFHANALMYFLFGVSDYTARIVPALFGVAMVGLPYYFRRWLGKAGALVASFFILISPSFLYYSRYIRNDIYITVWTLLLALALFNFVRDRNQKWLVVAAAVLSLSIASKEVAFITAFIGITFVALTLLWEWLQERGKRLIQIVFLLASVIPAAAILILRAIAPSDPTGTPSLAAKMTPNVMFVSFLLLAGVATMAILPRVSSLLTHAMRTLSWQRLKMPLLVFIAIYVVLFTTFFTNPKGILTGSVGAVGYWLAQQPVQRGSQPWYYYIFLMPFYELVPFFVGIPTVLYLVYKGTRERLDGYFGNRYWLAFLVHWSITSFVIYSWAGEKMPWLIVHPALPLLVIAAQVIGRWLSHQDWRPWYKNGGLQLTGLILLILAALFVIVRAQPFQGLSLARLGATGRWLGAVVIFFILLRLAYGFTRRLGWRGTLNALKVTPLLILTALTIRFAWMASYVNYDYPSEFLVYAHGAPDVKVVMEQIAEISRRIAGDNELAFSYDQEDVWPMEWYVKDYPNRIFYGNEPNKTAMDAPVVIVNGDNEAKAKPFLGDRYYRFQHRVVWWPTETYKNLTFSRIWQVIKSEKRLSTWFDIWFYRRYDTPFSDWPYQNKFALYIRKDILNQMWDMGVTMAIPSEMPVDPYQEVWRETPASLILGAAGTAPGQFTTPRGLATAPDGNIYVVDSGNSRVQVFSPRGEFLFTWGSPGVGPRQFTEPWGIDVAPNGDVYVADTWNHRVQWFDAQGGFKGMWGYFADVQGNLTAQPSGFWGPRDVVVADDGYVYVTDTGNKRVQKFTADGQFVAVFGGSGNEPGQFNEPVGLAIDNQGNFYVADTWNQRIQVLDKDFSFLRDWVVSSWEGQSLTNKPYLVADSDYVYASDPEGYRILVFDTEGTIKLTFGRYGNDAAGMNLPSNLALDEQGRLWVSDSQNNRLLRFDTPRP